jgi:hypothetical protein
VLVGDGFIRQHGLIIAEDMSDQQIFDEQREVEISNASGGMSLLLVRL